MNEYKIEILENTFNITQSKDGKVIFVNDKPFSIELIKQLSENFNIYSVNGKNFRLGIESITNCNYKLDVWNRDVEAFCYDSKTEAIKKFLNNSSSSDNSGTTKIKAPMPGLVVKILCEIGKEVQKGDTLMLIEAMKMENAIKSSKSGFVHKINVIEGKPVNKDELMIEIE